MSYNANQPTSVEVLGVVVRCGCTDKQKQDKEWHGLHDIVCPNPRKVENLGSMSYYHKNPFKVLSWKLKKFFN